MVELFLHAQRDFASKTNHRVWDFFIRAYYSRKNFLVWVDEASIWDYFLKYDVLEGGNEELWVQDARQKILDENKRLEDELVECNKKL